MSDADKKLQARGGDMDVRPANCRFRLKNEGKPYGRSSCSACGKGVFSGLGNQCSVAPDLMAELVEAAKPFALHATDRAVGSSEWRDKDVVSMFVTIGQLRAIVAALAKIKEPQHG